MNFLRKQLLYKAINKVKFSELELFLASRQRKPFTLAPNISSSSSDDNLMLNDHMRAYNSKELQNLIGNSDERVLIKLSEGVIPKVRNKKD